MIIDPFQTTLTKPCRSTAIRTAVVQAALADRPAGPVFEIVEGHQEVPSFTQPMAYATPANRSVCVAIDTRQFKGSNGFVVEQLDLLRLRASLTLHGFREESTNAFFHPVAQIAYANLMAGIVSSRFNIDPMLKLQIQVVAAAHYYNMTHGAEAGEAYSPSDLPLVMQSILRNLRVPADLIEPVLDKMEFGDDLASFCNNVRTVDGTERTAMFNPGMMINSCGGLWFGINAAETVGVAMEHAPTFCALLYGALGDGSYSRGEMSKRLKYVNAVRQKAETFRKAMRAIQLDLEHDTTSLGGRELVTESLSTFAKVAIGVGLVAALGGLVLLITQMRKGGDEKKQAQGVSELITILGKKVSVESAEALKLQKQAIEQAVDNGITRGELAAYAGRPDKRCSRALERLIDDEGFFKQVNQIVEGVLLKNLEVLENKPNPEPNDLRSIDTENGIAISIKSSEWVDEYLQNLGAKVDKIDLANSKRPWHDAYTGGRQISDYFSELDVKGLIGWVGGASKLDADLAALERNLKKAEEKLKHMKDLPDWAKSSIDSTVEKLSDFLKGTSKLKAGADEELSTAMRGMRLAAKDISGIYKEIYEGLTEALQKEDLPDTVRNNYSKTIKDIKEFVSAAKRA